METSDAGLEFRASSIREAKWNAAALVWHFVKLPLSFSSLFITVQRLLLQYCSPVIISEFAGISISLKGQKLAGWMSTVN